MAYRHLVLQRRPVLLCRGCGCTHQICMPAIPVLVPHWSHGAPFCHSALGRLAHVETPSLCLQCSETVQTVDSNQDNFLVEALKLPNLLAEFEYQDGHRINVRGSLSHQQKNGGSLWSRLTRSSQVQGPALVGFREWVFSEDSGALAEFAAATERSFGTTVQRIMHNPGTVAVPWPGVAYYLALARSIYRMYA